MMATKGNAYGLTEKRQRELFELSQDCELKRLHRFKVLYETTVRAALHAMDLCKADKKDAARNWHRYFMQSEILLILTESGILPESKIIDLKLLLLQLRDACHPDDRLSPETDIQHIRQMLEKLVEHAEHNQSPFFSFVRSRNEMHQTLAN